MSNTKTIINQNKKKIRDAEKQTEEKHILELQKAKEELEAMLSKIHFKPNSK